MKILVINPPNVPFTDPSLLIEPIDVLTIATFLRKDERQVTLLDMDHDRLTGVDLANELSRYEPDVIVIPFDYHVPLYTSESSFKLVELLATMLRYCGRIVIGGRPAQFYPELFLIDPRIVIVQNEMELALEELLALKDWSEASFGRIDGVKFIGQSSIKCTIPRKEKIDLDLLPIPDRSLVDFNNYIDVHSILSSRGCVEKCSFCPVHRFWGFWRKRSAGLVVDEIEYLVRDFGATKVLFLDDHATVDRRRIQQICNELIARKISVSLGCLGTASSLDPKTISLMAQAGFKWVHMGAEAGNDQSISSLHKRITTAQLQDAVASLKEAGLRVRTSWIVDPPKSTPEDLSDTIKLINETQSHEIRLHFLALRAGAPLAEQVGHARNELLPQYLHSDNPVLENPNLSRAKIIQEISMLTAKLNQEGYMIVKSPQQWGEIPREVLMHPQTRFVSLCPGRYGIGW